MKRISKAGSFFLYRRQFLQLYLFLSNLLILLLSSILSLSIWKAVTNNENVYIF